MKCFVPGHVLISPSFHPDEWRGYLSDALSMPFEILYSVEDILRHYGLGATVELFRKEFGHLPMVLRVPEGREDEAADALRGQKFIRAACPDLLIRPSGPIELSVEAIDEAIDFIGARAVGAQCGMGCNIAVLDSGIDPGVLSTPAALAVQQYDSQAPASLGLLPEDQLGHGSLVAYIINRIAPAARIFSVKVMDHTGAIGSLIAGLFLAEAIGPCHLLNMSLSVSCDGEPCPVCNTNLSASVNAEQLRYFFSQFMGGTSAYSRTIIAAAGNNYDHVAMPAIFPEVLAVGSFDIDRRQAAEESQYQHVPTERYIMAPGGRHSGTTLGAVPGLAFRSNQAILFGSSFATAFVTGVAARLACGVFGGQCGAGRPPILGSALREYLSSHLRETADHSWAGFVAERHGLGLIRYVM